MRRATLVFLLLFFFGTTAYAHSGKTDTSGGHKDNKNVSGLGGYHYHHGYSAHLHPDGVCPYEVVYSPEENFPTNEVPPKGEEIIQPTPAAFSEAAEEGEQAAVAMQLQQDPEETPGIAPQKPGASFPYGAAAMLAAVGGIAGFIRRRRKGP